MYKYKSEKFMNNLFEGVYIVDKKRKIVFWNSGSENITGYKAEEVVNAHCYQNILNHVDETGKRLCFSGCPLEHTLKTGEPTENHVFLSHKSGYRVPVSVKTLPLFDDDGNIVAAVEVFTDSRYKEDKYLENLELKSAAQYDELTKVYNRKFLDFKLKSLVSEVNQFEENFGILFIDIDHFKSINDQYGHNVGDEILKIVSTTVKNGLRPDDIFGRWGGEEFIAIINTDNINTLHDIAERIRMLVFNSNYKMDNSEIIRASISIGGTMFKEGENTSALIERADKNMYSSKNAGRNKVTVN
jgi:diguanylate cyclase (GGDEF)-like protein/PAS domain S-box-containing protein